MVIRLDAYLSLYYSREKKNTGLLRKIFKESGVFMISESWKCLCHLQAGRSWNVKEPFFSRILACHTLLLIASPRRRDGAGVLGVPRASLAPDQGERGEKRRRLLRPNSTPRFQISPSWRSAAVLPACVA